MDYLLDGTFVMRNGNIDKYLFEGGYAQATTGACTDSFAFNYYSKDHLGNVRSVVTKNPTTNEIAEVQQTHYYPFGGIIADISTGTSIQNKLYNGKELDSSNNLWWYDYGARQYDPTRGQFTNYDQHCESYYNANPLTYCGNNPVGRVDPTGMDWYEHVNNNGQKSAFWEDGDASAVTFGENTYQNVGTSYTTNYEWGDVTYNQNSVGEVRFNEEYLKNGYSNMYDELGDYSTTLSVCGMAYTLAQSTYMSGGTSIMNLGTQALGIGSAVASGIQCFYAEDKNEKAEAGVDTAVSTMSMLPGIGPAIGATYFIYKPIIKKGIEYTNQLNQYLENKLGSLESIGNIMQWGW